MAGADPAVEYGGGGRRMLSIKVFFEVRMAGRARGAGRKRKTVSRLRVRGSSRALRVLLEFRFEHTEIRR